MKEFSRKDRLGDQIKREVADIVQNILKDPRLGFVTITAAEITSDLRYSKIYYSVYGDEATHKDSHNVLMKSAGVIQAELGRRLKIRNVPQVSFHLDKSIEYGAHMEELFKKIQAERHGDDEEADES